MSLGELPAGLQPKELTTLSAYDLGLELNQIDRDTAAFTETAVGALRALAEAEAKAIADPTDIEAKMQVRVQRAVLGAAKLQLAQLNKRGSRIQTILRTTPQ